MLSLIQEYPKDTPLYKKAENQEINNLFEKQ